MRLSIFFLTLPLLSGCQGFLQHMANHDACLSQVDRSIPPQVQQRYLRTETKCSSSGVINQNNRLNPSYSTSGQTDCVSTPIYEYIILNQSQRDFAYNQCMSNTRARQATSYSTSGNSSMQLINQQKTGYDTICTYQLANGSRSEVRIGKDNSCQ